MTYLLLLLLAFAISIASSAIYLRFGLKYGPFAKTTFRSLHKRMTLLGGGVSIACAVTAVCLYLYIKGLINAVDSKIYILGGAVVATMGALDDRFDISPRIRLPFQIVTAAWICLWVHGLQRSALGLPIPIMALVGFISLLVACVWFYNLFNFIDGVDGMAATATIYISSTMGIVLWIHGQQMLALLLGSLSAASAGFLAFNWSPAKMFMGDAGSSYISYILSAVIVRSLWVDISMLWVWLIVCAYYFSDTTVTTIVRAATIPQWYLPHRSHTYQNLARIWDSHRNVVSLVIAINLAWLTPLLFLMFTHRLNPIAVTAVAYTPLVIFNLRYGPLFEDK